MQWFLTTHRRNWRAHRSKRFFSAKTRLTDIDLKFKNCCLHSKHTFFITQKQILSNLLPFSLFSFKISDCSLLWKKKRHFAEKSHIVLSCPTERHSFLNRRVFLVFLDWNRQSHWLEIRFFSFIYFSYLWKLTSWIKHFYEAGIFSN